MEPSISVWAGEHAPRIIGALEKEIKAVSSAHLLNVREGPGTNYPKLGVLERGAKLDVLEEENNWIKVNFGEGKTGWVHKNFVELHQDYP